MGAAMNSESVGFSTGAPILFNAERLPRWLRAPNTLARMLGIESPRLTPESLTASAARSAGLPARFPPHVERSLEVLCRSLRDEARLHWFGQMNQWTLLVTGLSALLRVEQALRDDPSLLETKLLAPVIVTGLPRSGTTFLHRLLSEATEAAGVPLYGHFMPTPRRPVDYRRLECAALLEPWRIAGRAYEMDAMHLMRSELPDECNWGMRIGGQSMIFWNSAPAYGYLHWVLGQDLRETYQLYRRTLLLHQRQVPGRRLTLKCPHHLAWLPALREAIPEAHIVQTHRDPLQMTPSECKLVLSMHALATDALDRRRTVDHVVFKALTFAERAVAFAESAPGERVQHVDYDALVSDPVQTARAIHASLGLPFSARHEAQLGAFASRNRQHKHGRNPYSIDQFGLDAGRLSEAFRPYRERFLAGSGRPQAIDEGAQT